MQALVNVMNLYVVGIVDVICTSDGYYVGRYVNDVGYNAFLGKPNPHPSGAGPARSWRVFRALDKQERRAVVTAARARNVNLRAFLVRE